MNSVGNLFAGLVLLSVLLCPTLLSAKTINQCKVLAVMSYHAEYQWQIQVKEGIKEVLDGRCEVRYFDLDTKRNPTDGPRKAEKAYDLYQSWKPDGVIAVDDNAQSMFVLPYLKNKVSTPVMFGGVNADPQKYGYPATNVSGILERHHLRDSLVLLKQMIPTTNKIGVIAANKPSNIAMINTIKAEQHSYPVQSLDFRLVDTISEAVAMTKELRNQTDALHIMGIEGLTNNEGKAMSAADSIAVIAEAYDKPTIGVVRYEVEAGALCAIIHRGQEQGGTAARMLLDAIQGKKVSELPITRNKHGQSVINVTELKKLGITPSSSIVRDADLVETLKK